MTETFKAIRGMHDILPDDTERWQQLENILKGTARQFAYREIRTPVLESTHLFKRSIGDLTDIVMKEMYTFEDRNSDSLTLRPEGTASCVRAGIEHSLFYHQVQKLWYLGPMYRHERPQKGRLRQFYQFGAEIFGVSTPDIDAELVSLAWEILQRLGLAEQVVLEINSLGDPLTREDYVARLRQYLHAHAQRLDQDAKTRLERNPLRVLDSKHPQTQEVVRDAPVLLDGLDQASLEHFERFRGYLDRLSIPYRINPRLVRGLDYYNRTVFEFVCPGMGQAGTLCAGGRLDGLVEQLGGKRTPAVGFAMGLERLLMMRPSTPAAQTDIYMVVDEGCSDDAFILAQELRRQCPSLRIYTHCGAGRLKSQFKKADKSGAQLALVVGRAECDAGTVTVKPLRAQGEQRTLPKEAVAAHLAQVVMKQGGKYDK